MTKRRFPMLAIVTIFTIAAAVSLTAQPSPMWTKASEIQRGQAASMRGTIQELDPAHSSFRLSADGEAPDVLINAITDAVSTQFSGFGAASEVRRGTDGFTQLRKGDRVEIRGTGAPDAVVNVTQVTLLGRKVEQATAKPAMTTALPRTVEGVVRQVNVTDGRLVIESDSREMTTILGRTTTPVYWQGDVYHIANLEVGDRVRIEIESTSNAGVRAKAIDVLQSVRGTSTSGRSTRTVGSVVGRVTRVDTRLETFRISRPGSTEVRVDAGNAKDSNGRAFRVSDLRVGDVVQISGVFESDGTLTANTIRFADQAELDRAPEGEDVNVVGRGEEDRGDTNSSYETVLVYGTVSGTLGSSNLLHVRETNSDRTLEIRVLDDFVVRLKSGSYITADQLKVGDRLAIQAFRNQDDEYIAQTIRIR